jgi:hypothetical protein
MRKRTDASSIWEARQRHDRENQESAALVLADLERYPEGSAMRRWAEMVAGREVQNASRQKH